MDEQDDRSPQPAWISPEALDRYDRDEAVVYLLDADGRLVWFNAAWDKFAAANGAPELNRGSHVGRFVLDVICEDLRDFYRDAFERARNDRREVAHVYECSTPETLRLFHMRILPAPERALVVVHSLVGGAPHGDGVEADAQRYTDASGVIRMCAHCRRSRRPEGGSWDWVPNLVKNLPPNVSHSLCGFCRAYHYPAS